MRRIYILRHAKAVAGTTEADIDRNLADQGIQDAAALGIYFKRKDYTPDYILCSPAARTQQTLEKLELPAAIKQDNPSVIYDGNKAHLLDILRDCPDNTASVLLVGHNPSLHELALKLADEDSALFGRLLQGFKPGTMAVLDCPVKIWADLQEHQNAIFDLTEPLDYNAPSTPARWM